MSRSRSTEKWLRRYEKNHETALNQLLHLLALPMIGLAVPLAVVGLFLAPVRRLARGLFIWGTVLQCAGHAVEGKRPEILQDWRFLLVGFRWWARMVSGRR